MSVSAARADLLSEDHFPTPTNTLLHQGLQIAEKTHFTLACNPHHRIASWVMFPLKKSDLDMKPRFDRITGNYSSDSLMSGPCRVAHSAYNEYTRQGYDRGHLADAESFNGTAEGNEDVATTSNITPQDLSFNRGIWAKLEGWQREQAKKEKEILVFVGPVLDPHLPSFKAGISIPEKFYKIIIDMTPPRKVIGFVIDQKDRGSFKKHWLCADEVEMLTGLEFATSALGAEKENLFKNCDLADWL